MTDKTASNIVGDSFRRPPTSVLESEWIYAANPARNAEDVTPYSGKWLLYFDEGTVDSGWNVLATATETGLLGPATKIASKGKARPYQEGEPPTYPACAYTNDCRDLADVTSVLAALRRLEFRQRLSYKEDNATLALLYGQGAALYVAQPNSIQFTQRRPIVEPPTCKDCGTVVDDQIVLPHVPIQCQACWSAQQKPRPRKARTKR